MDRRLRNTVLFFVVLLILVLGFVEIAHADEEGTNDLATAVIVPGTVLVPLDEVEEPADVEPSETPSSDEDAESETSDPRCPESYTSVKDYYEALEKTPDCFDLDSDEATQSDEENTKLIEEMCAEWNAPGHGSWALDPGDEDLEYTNSMNETCGTPSVTPEPEPVVETPEPTATPTSIEEVSHE